MSQAKILNVGRGDRVRIEFFSFRKPPVVATVIDVERRYGKSSYGRVPNPLITYRSDSGVVDFCDVSYVAEILKRGVPRRTNIFADDLSRISERVSPGPRRGTMQGRIVDLAALELAQLPFRLIQPLNEKRLLQLFRAQRPGVLQWNGYSYAIVRRKSFRKWVRHNAYQILKTVAELNAAQTEQRRSTEAMIEADLDAFPEPDIDNFDADQYPREDELYSHGSNSWQYDNS